MIRLRSATHKSALGAILFAACLLLMPGQAHPVKLGGNGLSKISNFFGKHAMKCAGGLFIAGAAVGIEAALTGNQLHGLLAMGAFFNGAAIVVLDKTKSGPSGTDTNAKSGTEVFGAGAPAQNTGSALDATLRNINIKLQGVAWGIKNAWRNQTNRQRRN